MSDRTDADPVRWIIESPSPWALNQARWSAVGMAFGLGSTSATSLCRRFGFDPDQTRREFRNAAIVEALNAQADARAKGKSARATRAAYAEANRIARASRSWSELYGKLEALAAGGEKEQGPGSSASNPALERAERGGQSAPPNGEAAGSTPAPGTTEREKVAGSSRADRPEQDAQAKASVGSSSPPAPDAEMRERASSMATERSIAGDNPITQCYDGAWTARLMADFAAAECAARDREIERLKADIDY